MQIKKNFNKKVIFITGSSSGMGYGLAKSFLDLGNEVIICSKNIRKLKFASKSLNDCFFVRADLSKENDIKKAIKKIKLRFKKIDVLICNYGSSNHKKNNLDFNYAFNNNFFPTVNVVNYAQPIIKKEGNIICISSICGVESIKDSPIGYSVAKSALNNFVKSISYSLSQKKILINCIAPGNIYFKGSTWEKKIKKNKHKVKKYINKNVPLKKFGSINEIFNLCRYLSSSQSFSTGATYILDGGQTRVFR